MATKYDVDLFDNFCALWAGLPIGVILRGAETKDLSKGVFIVHGGLHAKGLSIEALQKQDRHTQEPAKQSDLVRALLVCE